VIYLYWCICPLLVRIAFSSERYSFAHGGKDGHPYPVDRKIYDRSIEILRIALDKFTGSFCKIKILFRKEFFLLQFFIKCGRINN